MRPFGLGVGQAGARYRQHGRCRALCAPPQQAARRTAPEVPWREAQRRGHQRLVDGVVRHHQQLQGGGAGRGGALRPRGPRPQHALPRQAAAVPQLPGSRSGGHMADGTLTAASRWYSHVKCPWLMRVARGIHAGVHCSSIRLLQHEPTRACCVPHSQLHSCTSWSKTISLWQSASQRVVCPSLQCCTIRLPDRRVSVYLEALRRLLPLLVLLAVQRLALVLEQALGVVGLATQCPPAAQHY